jgi:hypothetical protein
MGSLIEKRERKNARGRLFADPPPLDFCEYAHMYAVLLSLLTQSNVNFPKDQPSSPRRKPGSTSPETLLKRWIPAFAGMTIKG